MGKQINATVYYCDKCRKPVIGSGTILKEAEYFQVANHISEEYIKQFDTNIIAHAPVIGKIVIPEISYSAIPNSDPDSSTSDICVKVEGSTKYLCQDCLENIVEEYTELCNQINELWETQ